MKVLLTATRGSNLNKGKAHDEFVDYCKRHGFTNYSAKDPEAEYDWSVIIDVKDSGIWDFITKLIAKFNAPVMVLDKAQSLANGRWEYELQISDGMQ